MLKQYLSVKEAAEQLEYTVQHLRLLIRQEKLKAEKIGRDWLVLSESVTEYRTNKSLDNVID